LSYALLVAVALVVGSLYDLDHVSVDWSKTTLLAAAAAACVAWTEPIVAAEPACAPGQWVDDDGTCFPAKAGSANKPSTTAARSPHAGGSTPTALMASGGAIFLLGYIPCVIAGALAEAEVEDADEDYEGDAESYLPMFLPIAGPPITGALVDASDAGWGALLALAGAQVVGLTMFIVGVAIDPDEPSPSVALYPLIPTDGRLGAGLSMSATF